MRTRDRSRRGELQQLLGELGTVEEWCEQSTASRLGRGWYARLADGREVYLGDRAAIAAITISRLADPPLGDA